MGCFACVKCSKYGNYWDYFKCWSFLGTDERGTKFTQQKHTFCFKFSLSLQLVLRKFTFTFVLGVSPRLICTNRCNLFCIQHDIYLSGTFVRVIRQNLQYPPNFQTFDNWNLPCRFCIDSFGIRATSMVGLVAVGVALTSIGNFFIPSLLYLDFVILALGKSIINSTCCVAIANYFEKV